MYPAFPYPSYRHMSIKDVRDLFAFLRTPPPVSGRAPPNALAFPFSIRRAVGFWKLLYLPQIDHPIAVDPTDGEALGRYLVNGPGHCAECHSPRDVFGGIIASRRLTGGPLPDGKGKAPNITAEGLKDWSEDDVETALSTGFTPSGDVLGGAMAADSAQPRPSARAGPRRDRPLPQDLQARRGSLIVYGSNRGDSRRGVGANAIDHRAHAVRSLRRQMLLEAELAESAQGVDGANLLGRLIGVERDRDRDQSSHQMRVAVAAIVENRPSVRIRSLLPLEPDLADAAPHLVDVVMRLFAQRLEARGRARSHSDTDPPTRRAGRNRRGSTRTWTQRPSGGGEWHI